MAKSTPMFELDLDQLDTHLLEQSQMYAEFADALADAELDLDEAEADLIVVKAEVEREIRAKPKRFGISKDNPREQDIKVRVPLHISYQQGVKKVNKRKHRVNILKGRVRAMEHRKSSLERLVILRTMDYFSEPRVGKEARRIAADHIKDKVRRSIKPKEEDDDEDD